MKARVSPVKQVSLVFSKVTMSERSTGLAAKEAGSEALIEKQQHRLRFTEVELKHDQAENEQMPKPMKQSDELDRLQKQTAIPGKTTISMLEQFRRFPWTQDAMMLIRQEEEIIKKFLEVYLKIDHESVEV